jgi:hypothetical protein
MIGSVWRFEIDHLLSNHNRMLIFHLDSEPSGREPLLPPDLSRLLHAGKRLERLRFKSALMRFGLWCAGLRRSTRIMEWLLGQIPPDLVVKRQAIDNAEVTFQLIWRRTIVQTSCRHMISRGKPLPPSQVHRFTTKSDGMWEVFGRRG